MRSSDALLILTDGNGLAASQGTALAHDLAARDGKPLLMLGLDQADAITFAARWLDDILSGWPPDASLKLGIGGPRESEASRIYATAFALLQGVLRGR